MLVLLGATTLELAREADKCKEALAATSIDLLAWEKTLPNGKWIERPEQYTIEARFQLETSSTVLLGEPGSGKSALLSKIAADLKNRHAAVFALKADFLSTDVRSESDLQRELQLFAPPSEMILRLARLQPVFVFIDQLDALASQLDLRSGRLNVLLNLFRRIGGVCNVHVLLSARSFEFNHDVRLRMVDAEGVTLALPPWHDVKQQLADVGIDPDTWPEKAQDVVRIPQALKTYMVLASGGRSEPFATYQAMLEQLWHDRIAATDGGPNLVGLASDLATRMADEETLWLAASRFDDDPQALKRLEALGLVVRSENNLSVAFSHQTIFEYVLARTFVRSAGMLSNYVRERQGSLFVRGKVWAALTYTREAEVNSYEREFRAIWKTTDLRRHLRLLLIEFLGEVRQPLDFEKAYMTEVLSTVSRPFGRKAIANSPGWFVYFASSAIRDAMSVRMRKRVTRCGSLCRTGMRRANASFGSSTSARLLRDSYSWSAIRECPQWTDEVEAVV